MQLRAPVEWALHCCAILAALPPGHYLATRDLAELHGVPKEYLSKALQGLSQADLVESTLGPSGGYRLARAPEGITFLDIVEAIEGKGPTFVCTEIRRNNPCLPAGHCDNKPCAVARVMWDADRAWRDRLRATALSDLLTTLEKDVPARILKKTRDWVLDRK
jgi:Rrf2 family protein